MQFRPTSQCITCYSSQKRKVFEYSGFDSINFTCYKCRECDLLYASPQPIITADALNEIYNSNYYKNYFGEANDYSNSSSKTNQIISNRLKKEFTYFSRFIVEDGEKKNVLDIGCGDGRFLSHFIDIGWRCFGIEPSNFASEIAKKRSVTILKKGVLELTSEHEFDFIFLDNVIEHLDYPAKYIEKIHGLLSSKGVFVLKTPNSDGFVERTETLILSLLPNQLIKGIMGLLYQKLKIGSGVVHRYGNLHPPVHLSIFNRKSVTAALAKAGFKENEILVLSGSEYYHEWKVERPRPKGIFANILKSMKKFGDSIGRGEMLVAIVKKGGIGAKSELA
jgi:SAM-dependent methyltransferase